MFKWIWDIISGNDDVAETLRDLRIEALDDHLKEKDETIKKREAEIELLKKKIDEKDKTIEHIQGHNSILAEKWNRMQGAIDCLQDEIEYCVKDFRKKLRTAAQSNAAPVAVPEAVLNQIKSSARAWGGTFNEDMRAAFKKYMERVQKCFVMEGGDEVDLVQNPAPWGKS